jgi:hypothetical protein
MLLERGVASRGQIWPTVTDVAGVLEGAMVVHTSLTSATIGSITCCNWQ